MPWILALHLIFVVAWFAGLFYLPRLFVYHAASEDRISQDRFKIMEHKLFWIIMTPAGILASVFGLWLLCLNPQDYLQHGWMIAKLILVFFLWMYHVACGFLLQFFKLDRNPFPSVFFRFFNEVPTVFLFAIVILAVVRP